MVKKAEKRVLLLDMYGVIIKESKGNFVPYTLKHFEKNEHARIIQAIREEQMFTKAGNGLLSSDDFLRYLGFKNPEETMRDYLENYLTLDEQFVPFAEKVGKEMDMVLLSNDVWEWSEYLTHYHQLEAYFQDKIISGRVHMRKPDERIFAYALERTGRSPADCIFVDNSVKNLQAARKVGMEAILFNRDGEVYDGVTVNNFEELAIEVKKI